MDVHLQHSNGSLTMNKFSMVFHNQNFFKTQLPDATPPCIQLVYNWTENWRPAMIGDSWSVAQFIQPVNHLKSVYNLLYDVSMNIKIKKKNEWKTINKVF